MHDPNDGWRVVFVIIYDEFLMDLLHFREHSTLQGRQGFVESFYEF